MNQSVIDYTRNEIKEGLSKLPESWVHIFKQMYSHKNLDADIESVVDSMDEDKLDWALTQVQNSLAKIQG